MNRYARQICLPEIGPAGQAALAGAHVLVAGAGGLGATLLPLLAGAGVGHLRIADPDRVEETNLHRQILYRMADIGQPKALVAASTLAALNPGCRVSALPARLEASGAGDDIARADLVIDAADNFATSYALSDLCQGAGKPLISASVLGRQGYVGGFCGGGPSLRALFPDLPGTAQTCATGGVMGPAVATLGALQAQMALSVLLGHEPSSLGQLLSVDLASWRITGFRFDAAPEPPVPVPAVISRDGLRAGDLVIDLRKGDALRPCDLPLPKGRRAVFICVTGLRAWRAARALHDAGHDNVAILAEGS